MSPLFVAWSLWGFSLLLVAADSVLIATSRPDQWLIMPLAMLNATLGLLIIRRHPRHPVGWAFCASGVLFAFFGFCLGYGLRSFLVGPPLPGAATAAWVADWGWILPVTLLSIVIPLLFPDGRLTSGRWRVLLVGGLAAAGLASLGAMFSPGPLEQIPTLTASDIQNPYGITGTFKSAIEVAESAGTTLLVAAFLGAAVSVGVRFRRSRGAERQQLKWLAYAAAMTGVVMVVMAPFWDTEAGQTFGPVVFLLIPLGAGIAILRHRLYDIDLVIRRTVVFGVLAAFIGLIYVGLVFGLGRLTVGFSGGNVALSIAATAIIAIAFQPARMRVQQFANRLVYGDRLSPYEVMAEFSERMTGALTLEEVLPRMAESAARGIGAERTRVTVFLPDGTERMATWPEDSTDGSFVRKVTVAHRGDHVGEISVTKPRSEPLTTVEERLLSDLASQAGPALHNVRLAEDLRASRRRIVSAQDEERRRLERNLHDGAQQGLVALKVKLGLAERLAASDPVKARELLNQLQNEADETLENVRDLARGIYPPLLADRGLEAALTAQANKSPLPAAVHGEGIGRYPLELEAAVYFCCLEAIQNASKYAGANRLEVRLGTTDGQLVFSVADNGRGFDPATTPKGAGLRNMTDRIDALGGTIDVHSTPGEGTTIAGRVPVGNESDLAPA